MTGVVYILHTDTAQYNSPAARMLVGVKGQGMDDLQHYSNQASVCISRLIISKDVRSVYETYRLTDILKVKYLLL